MALHATGTITANGSVIIPGTPSGRSSLPTTFAILPSSTMGGGTAQLQAGFVNAAGTTEWINVGAAFSAAGQAVNVAMRANYFQIVTAGATTPSIKWWFG